MLMWMWTYHHGQMEAHNDQSTVDQPLLQDVLHALRVKGGLRAEVVQEGGLDVGVGDFQVGRVERAFNHRVRVVWHESSVLVD